ncbi:TPA: glycosyltransferase [Streptococcus suis]|nr:glycosyltransferase [Streptococcus suis]
MKILAGIVTFNPNLKRLKANVSAVRSQVEDLIIVDNGSENLSEIREYFSDITIIPFYTNKGIASALNYIGQYAIENSFEWFLTLDQDTEVVENLISLYKTYLDLPKAGIISSQYQDINEPIHEFQGEEYSIVDDVITSAALMNTRVFSVSNRFDEWMFIDLVDFDINREINRLGYQIYKINQLGFYHEIGTKQKIEIFGKKIYPKNHSPFRKYYIYRNTIYMLKKYGFNSITIKYGRDLIIDFWKVMLFERQKSQKLSAMLRGLWDGLRCKVTVRNK